MADEAEKSVSAIASKKYGGVPLWVWGAGVAGLIVAYTLYKNYKANQSATAVQSTTTDNTNATGVSSGALSYDPTTGDVYDATTGTDYGSLSTSPYFPMSSTGLTTVQGIPAATNSEWLTNAETALLGQGHAPLEVLSALSKFINGNTLTSAEQSIVNAAITAEGLPPDTSSVTTTPATPTTPAPSTGSGASASLSIVGTGTALPSVEGSVLPLLVTYKGFPAGTSTVRIESSGSLTGGQFNVIKTFYVKGPAGVVPESAPINESGTVQVKAVSDSGKSSNVITLHLAKKTPVNPAVKK